MAWFKTNNETKKKSRNKREKTSLRSLVVKRGKGETIEWTVVPRKGKGTNWKKGRRQ